MKPNFALSLSFEGIHLLFRAADGWRSVGTVHLESESFAQDLKHLRAKAMGLAPEGVHSKLIIPNDQIKYLSIHTKNVEDSQRRLMAIAALEEATPYKIEDLAFALQNDGEMTHIAATARVTLQEAESFAMDNAFNPVSLVATPQETAAFSTEPFFGLTRNAEILKLDLTPDTAKTQSIGPIQEQPPTELLAAISERSPSQAPSEPTQLSLPIASGDSIEVGTQAKAPSPPPASETAAHSKAAIGPENAQTAKNSAASPAQPSSSEKPAPKKQIIVAPLQNKLPDPVDEAERLTIFGARGHAAPSGASVIGGWITLSIAAFTCLILIAGGWFAFFAEGGISRFFSGPPDIVIAKQTEQPDIAPQYLDKLSPEDAAILDALRQPRQDSDDETAGLSDQELTARYAVTGIWPKAPARPSYTPTRPLQDLYMADIDPNTPSEDVIALPDVQRLMTDYPMGTPTRPMAAGTVFAMDQNGFVIPTVQGAVSPDGVLVYLGRPVAIPPKTPERSQFSSAESAVIATLSKIRPTARPKDQWKDDAPSDAQRELLKQIAKIRPQQRPQIAKQDEASETALAAAQPETETTAQEGNSSQATVVSLRPASRPKNFAKIVNRATNDSKPQRVAAASEILKPRAKTTASVAKSATVKNALKLKRVNLIGVYGKPSNRRALVRLSNGSFKKVKVGDRIDGGRISAIGDTELRYKKGGRNVVLKMPRG